MKVIKISKIIKLLEQDGWYIDRTKGSHRQFKHPSKKGTVTVNGKPSDDVWGTLLSSIEEQSGLKF
jgi:predicted RNA binding protein YcfA (HicA-like mRNA interferase family)